MFPKSTRIAAPAEAVGGPRLNALKHGFYSAAILLPGDDADAFKQERRALFELYRPQNIREAKLVQAIAEFQWQLDRSAPLQAQADEQALAPATDAAGRMTEPLAHKRLHTTMDTTLHRQRIDRAIHRNHKELIGVQKLRRMGLIEGARKLPPGCYLETSGALVRVDAPVPGQQAGCQVAPETREGVATLGVSASADSADGFFEEQKERGNVARQPAGRNGREPGPVALPEWLTVWDGARQAPTRVGSGSPWVGYSVVGSA